METHKALLLVRIPSLADLADKKLGLGFDSSMGLLEACAFLQEILAGLWNISHTGDAEKLTFKADHHRITSSSLWIDLVEVTPLEITCARLHFAHVQSNSRDTLIDRPVISFKVEGFPRGGPTIFEIGAAKRDGVQAVTYTFK